MNIKSESAANHLLVTKFSVPTEYKEQVIDLWNSSSHGDDKSRQLYFAEDTNIFVELIAVPDINCSVKSFLESINNEFTKSASHLLSSDWHRQLIEVVEEVKPQGALLPQGSYIQLRYIEVPMSVYNDYLVWREKTIFEHVKKHSEIKSFVAYHTAISTQPGVLFVSSFDISESEYLACFAKPEYREIVRQAGSKYIAGGEKCLYTQTFNKVGEL